MKTFELERHQLGFEEQSGLLRQSNLLVEQLRKKVELLRGEYHNLEKEFSQKVASQDAQLAEKDEKLKSFTALERDLEDAFAAGEGSLCLFSLSGSQEAIANVFAATLGGSSAMSSRRMTQTLQL